jgi:hypothetical protein
MLVSAPQTTFTFPMWGLYVITVTLGTPVTFSGNDLALSTKWKGGENDDVPGTQGTWSDYSAGIMVGAGQTVFGPDYGFADPANVNIVSTNDFSTPKLDYMEEEAVIIPKSSWGYRNFVTPNGLFGTNIHTINSNLSTTAGNFGWDIDAGPSNQGGYALVLLNIALSPFPASFNLLGQTFELNIADPAITLGGDLGYVLPLNTVGFATGPNLTFPAMPMLSSFYLGAEAAIIDPLVTTVKESTQAAHIRFQ